MFKKYFLAGLIFTNTSFNLHAEITTHSLAQAILTGYSTAFISVLSMALAIRTRGRGIDDPKIADNTLKANLAICAAATIGVACQKINLDQALVISFATGLISGECAYQYSLLHTAPDITNYNFPPACLNNLPSYHSFLPIRKLANKPVLTIIADTPTNYLLAIDQFYLNVPQPRVKAYDDLLEIKNKLIKIKDTLYASNCIAYDTSYDYADSLNLLEHIELRLKCLQ